MLLYLVILRLLRRGMRRCKWLVVVQRPHDAALLLLRRRWRRLLPRLLLRRQRQLRKLLLRHEIWLPGHC